jgi:hypothetical protein
MISCTISRLLAGSHRLFNPVQPEAELTPDSCLLTPISRRDIKGEALAWFAHSDLREAMSIEKRYFTSDLSSLSYASLTF